MTLMSKNDIMISSTFKVNSVKIGDFNVNVVTFYRRWDYSDFVDHHRTSGV